MTHGSRILRPMSNTGTSAGRHHHPEFRRARRARGRGGLRAGGRELDSRTPIDPSRFSSWSHSRPTLLAPSLGPLGGSDMRTEEAARTSCPSHTTTGAAPRRRARATAVVGATVVVMVSLGAGSLTASQVPFAPLEEIDDTWQNPRDMTFADIDGDGDLDLAATSSNGDLVSWWENTAGDASAWIRHDIDLSFDDARGIEAADLDGDGDVDLVAAAFNQDEVRWYENDPTLAVCGTPFCPSLVGTGDGTNKVDIGDIDGDGDLDIVATVRADDDVVWLHSTLGDASAWTRHVVEGFIDGAAVVRLGDLDGDGDLDVLVEGQENGGSFAWIENNVDGAGPCLTAWCTTPLDTGVGEGLAIADLDHDGDLDLLRSESSGLAWWENTAGDASAFVEQPITASRTRKLTVADLDADGDLDVLAGGPSTLWLENTAGDASAWTQRSLPGFGDRAVLVAGDLDGDGDDDIAGVSFSVDHLAWVENQTLHRSAAVGAGLDVGGAVDGNTFLVSVDLDRDGDLDHVRLGENADTVVWTENDGTGFGWTDHVIGGGDLPIGLDAGDIDGDGDDDILVGFENDEEIVWLENAGASRGTWTEWTIATMTGGGGWKRFADIDGDGDLDVASTNTVTGTVSWFENDGDPYTGTWTEHTVDSGFALLAAVAPGDIDGDGDVDLVIGGADGDVVVYGNDGSPVDGGWTEVVVVEGLFVAFESRLCDLDVDGDLDILTSQLLGERLSWLENPGGALVTGWAARDIQIDYLRPYSPDCADLDADGDVDVAGVAFDDYSVDLWLSDGTPHDGGWVRQQLSAEFPEPVGARFVDVDRDGRLDVMASSFASGTTRWWRNVGGQFALPTSDAVVEAGVEEGEGDVVLLRIDGTHRGRAGDGDAELATLELLLEEESGDPLSDAELDGLVAALRLWLDDGDETFDTLLDSEFFALAPPYTVTDGVLTLTMVDGDPNVQLALGGDVTWWLSADLATGSTVAALDTLQVTHVTSASSTGEMTSTDIPLVLEGQDDVSSTLLEISLSPFVATAIGDQIALEGVPFVFDIAPAFDDPNGEVLEFTASGLPESFSISSGGEISGIATALDYAGSPYIVTVTATDPGALDVDDIFELSINGVPDLVAPIADQVFDQDSPVSLDVSGNFQDPDGDPVSFLASGLPDSLSMSSAGVLTGTPLASEAGASPYVITVEATDGFGLTAIDVFSLTVNGFPVVVSPLDDRSLAEGAPTSIDLSGSFSDPNGDVLTFTATGLPPSLRLEEDGTLVGVPATVDLAGSPYTVTVTATESGGASASDSFELTLQDDPDALFVDGFETGSSSAWSSTTP
ncbi:MAG: hypothetical protein DWQ36_20780 [Acidobacteria bacterium]|nr:MAG: hypothetical protein DWQ36_20780 [Acidobacteriota bacterium]